MEEFVTVPYFQYTTLNYFLEKNFGLLTILPAALKEKTTQTDPPPQSIKEQSTQTEKPGLLWYYFG